MVFESPGGAIPKTKRQTYDLLHTQLNTDRSSFVSHWQDLADFQIPRRMRLTTDKTNRGVKVNSKIFDSSATFALGTLRAGMMAGVTSPARPWFRLTTPDPGLAEFGPVKRWLYTVTQRMNSIFLRSNLYNALPLAYGDLGGFGTACILVLEDMSDFLRCYSFPIGSYYLGLDGKLRVNTFLREFRLTVRQVVENFGVDPADPRKIHWDNISPMVHTAWDNSQYLNPVEVFHVISPNPDYDPKMLGANYKRFSSCYYEKGAGNAGFGGDEKFLRESGFDSFPVLAPRWEVTGEDAYGTNCPGMVALGDVKALQTGEKRMDEAIEKMVRPPMAAPSSLRTSSPSILPGSITYYDASNQGQKFEPILKVEADVQKLELRQQERRYRIRRAYYEDLFLMLASDSRNRVMTATEVQERHEEKLLALGPVLEQLNQDLLDPLIDLTFAIMISHSRGSADPVIPVPPKELQGMPLRVEYISIMSQAQKVVGLAGLEKTAAYVSNMAQAQRAAGMAPTAFDKFNVEESVDVYGDMTGVDPHIIRGDDEVAAIQADRARAQQAAQSAAQAQQGAVAAKNLSAAKMGPDSALTRLIQSAKAGQQLVPAAVP